MKTLKTLVITLFVGFAQMTVAQETVTQETMSNPTAKEDIKVVNGYLDAIVNNKMEKAASLLADDFIGSGPSNGETRTKAENIASWTQSHKSRTNQKNDYVRHSFRVVGGDLEGDWVAVWGTYTFTQDGKDMTLPYQFTAEVKEGKIKRAVTYYDRLAINEAMGYTVLAPKKGK